MAKKRKQSAAEEQRQSRKEVLLARKQAKQNRQIRLAVLGIVLLLVIVFGIGIVNELFIKPTQPVVSVNGLEISLGDWQDRVRFQRAQLIIGIEDLENTVGGDIGLVQQFAGQQMQLLLPQQADQLGQLVLNDMIDDQLIRQEAERRGITVSDAEVDARIEENFNYFGGQSPTPFPTSTATVIPTPSITPIPTEVISDVVPTAEPTATATAGPTSTPLPTATPVSSESYQEELTATLERFQSYGVDEATYRDYIRGQLYREKLTESLADSEGFLTEDEQVRFYFLSFKDEAEANEAKAMLENEDFLTVWNTIRSRQSDAESGNTGAAGEVQWRQKDSVETSYGTEVANAAFDLEIDQVSDILIEEAASETESATYYIVDVTGREVRPLTDNVIQQEKDQILTNWLQGQARTNVETFELWQSNVPTQPLLDTRFFVQPTEVPAQPTLPLPEAVPTQPEQ